MKIHLIANSLQAKNLAESIGIDAEFRVIDPSFVLKKGEAPPHFIERILKEETSLLSLETKNLLSVRSVFVGRRLIVQPKTKSQAVEIMKLYSGRNHTIVCGVCCVRADGKLSIKRTVTRVKVKVLSMQDIADFTSTNEWQTNGGYNPTGYFLQFIQSVVGSYTGMLGLPCYEASNLYKVLKSQ